tara:strand:- start:36 stop:1031 length:996 start_codon:yes stop_codon:yes gene_type:complete
MRIPLTKEDLIHKSGTNPTQGDIKPMRKKYYTVLTESVGGDAPKDVIRFYQYGKGKIANPKSWTKYIAKIGHKWYPNESITEHFLTSVGKSFGIPIANSQLVQAEGYVRFLSEHFHNEEQSLIHGANILSRYLSEKDTKWIDDLDNQRLLKGEINIKDVIIALQDVFPDNTILDGFVDMLLFDCLTGNNDRHYYNWGVITHIKNKHQPYYSPIYDTARGLFWNNDENFIVSLHNNSEDIQNKRIAKYVKNSVPKISIPNNDKCNHFQLIEYLKNNNYIKKKHIARWSDKASLERTLSILNKDFVKLFTTERRHIIEKILNLRFQMLKCIIQ